MPAIDKLISTLNPQSAQASFVVRADTDMTEINATIKAMTEVYPSVGITLDNNIISVELDLLFNAISKGLISKGRDFCDYKWVKEQLIFTFIGAIRKESVNVINGDKLTFTVLPEICELSDDARCDLFDRCQTWARLKKLI